MQRDSLKVTSLSTQYGTSSQALAERLDQPDIVGRNLLACYHRVFKIFWKWSDNSVSRSLIHNRQDTVFGWTLRFLERPRINSVRNFFMQANGAEMMRLAACLATENGILVCAPVHDAFLITAPIDRLPADVERMRAYMEEASAVVLNGSDRGPTSMFSFIRITMRIPKAAETKCSPASQKLYERRRRP